MWIAIIAALAVLTLLGLLLLPRPVNPADGPLPEDVETRILLGERPEDIDSDSAPAPGGTDGLPNGPHAR